MDPTAAPLVPGVAVSRRTWLRATTAAAGLSVAGIQAAPSADRPAGSAPTRPKPSARVNLGFIGTGRQATYANLPGFLSESDAQVVAVCDVDAWRLEQAQRQVEAHYARSAKSGEFKGCLAFRDWRELVARPDIDAVMISTPDHWHVPMAVAALKAGKDVACEKPLTRSIAEGRLLSRLATSRGRVFRTDSEFRSNRAMHRAVEWVRNGRIGKLRQITTATPKDSTLPSQPQMPVPPELDYDLWLGPAPEAPYTEQRVHPRHDRKGRPGWICIRSYADGMLANWGAHLNDIALWAMDADRTGPVAVEGVGQYPPKGHLWDVIQEFDVRFTFATGIQLTCKTDQPYIRFEGDGGWIRVGYPNDVTASDSSLLDWKPGTTDLALPFKTSEKRDFLDAVHSRGATQGDAEVGHRVTSLCHLGLIAIDLGRKLHWDPIQEAFPDDPEANRRLRPIQWRAPWDRLLEGIS
ncbi:MAG: Gfo/Idh/MocA family oxidoreductase [Verrucomicrobiales bacterium]|nr:Gfo/Idh/MocA family oxidoreductase [Verrucomicrobiales bacterium]